MLLYRSRCRFFGSDPRINRARSFTMERLRSSEPHQLVKRRRNPLIEVRCPESGSNYQGELMNLKMLDPADPLERLGPLCDPLKSGLKSAMNLPNFLHRRRRPSRSSRRSAELRLAGVPESIFSFCAIARKVTGIKIACPLGLRVPFDCEFSRFVHHGVFGRRLKKIG